MKSCKYIKNRYSANGISHTFWKKLMWESAYAANPCFNSSVFAISKIWCSLRTWLENAFEASFAWDTSDSSYTAPCCQGLSIAAMYCFFLPLLHVVLTELFSLALHAACRRLELHWADPSQTRWYSNHRRRRYFGLDDEVVPSPGLSCVGTQTILQSRLAFDHGHEARPKMVKINRPNSSHQLTHHTLHATYLGSVAVCQEFVDIVQEHEIFLMNLL